MSTATRPRASSALARMGRRDVLRRSLTGGVALAAASTFPAQSFAAGLPAKTSHGDAKVSLTEHDVTDLQKSLRGQVILPSSPDYEAARHTWNGRFDHHPALIARCTSAADVQAAVQFARAKNLLTAVRCGGHSYVGASMSDGGITIDLSPFNTASVDPAAKIARVSGGAMLGTMDEATMKHGLATTAGVVSHTGIGGLATGGGQGRLQRKYGMTVDNIRGVEIVTADGQLLRANANENPDLFWAVRGGGGNFGIVTQFEMQLHEIGPKMTTFSFSFPGAKAADVMKFYFDVSPTAPDELSWSVGVRNTGKGETTVSLSGTYMGSPEACEKAIKAIAALGTPINKRLGDMDYVALQKVADAGAKPGHKYYMRVLYINRVDHKIGETILDVVKRNPTMPCSIGMGQQGGASGRVANDAMAYPNRGALYQLTLPVDWDDPKDGDPLIANNRKLWAQLAQLGDGGFYVNHIQEEGDAEIRKNYAGNYARLVDIKTKYDSTNFFHLNANIRPRKA